jgi:hypothetical protein
MGDKLHEIVDKRQKTDFRLDNFLIDHEGISGVAKIVYAVLARHEGRDKTKWPRTDTIAKKAGFHHTPVERALKELEDWNIITVHRKRGSANQYVLMDKGLWKSTPPGSVVGQESTPPGSVVGQESTPPGSVVGQESTPPGSVVGQESTPPGSVEGFKDFKDTDTLASGEAFERFWKAYPKQMRKDKIGAQQVWKRLKAGSGLVNRIMGALEAQKQTDLWNRGIGIPYPGKWLRNKRWEDETEQPPDRPPGEGPPEAVEKPRFVRVAGQWYKIQGGRQTAIAEAEVSEGIKAKEKRQPVNEATTPGTPIEQLATRMSMPLGPTDRRRL